MPANLSPQYKEAERKYKSTRDKKERLACLREMLALIPKHKGTEKLQADLKAKISKLNDELRHGKKSGAHRHTFHIERVPNIPQLVLLGYPNVGKSQLLGSLTHAKSEVTPYPFATRQPIPGIMSYEDIKIELIDTTAITNDFMEPWISDIVRGVDAMIILVDLGEDNVLDQVQDIIDRLMKVKIVLVGRQVVSTPTEDYTILRKPTLIVGNKSDLDIDEINAKTIIEFYGNQFDFVSISALNQTNLNAFTQMVFKGLEIIRVYTKVPGHKPDLANPFVLPKGSTVLEVARVIHKEIAEHFHTARIWGSTKFEGQHVEKDYIVQDKDIVEIHL
ncbi:MAG: 50S ribosome-binding GTPase [bacterium]|nr:50S ribosome-binding GTPase [bacterium]